MKQYKIPQIKLTYVGEPALAKPKISGSKTAANIFRDSYKEGEIEYTEHFKVMYLNRANEALGIYEISYGGTSACIVDAKVIFTGALLANAHFIILCHNHPSGILRSSIQDDAITKSIAEAGKMIGIEVLDHIIVTRDSYYSYKDEMKI